MCGETNSTGFNDQELGFLDMTLGGLVAGPGDEGSGSIPAVVPKGAYILNAETVKAIGVEQLAAFNSFGHMKVDCSLSPGDFVLNPMAVAVLGLEFLDAINENGILIRNNQDDKALCMALRKNTEDTVAIFANAVEERRAEAAAARANRIAAYQGNPDLLPTPWGYEPRRLAWATRGLMEKLQQLKDQANLHVGKVTDLYLLAAGQGDSENLNGIDQTAVAMSVGLSELIEQTRHHLEQAEALVALADRERDGAIQH